MSIEWLKCLEGLFPLKKECSENKHKNFTDFLLVEYEKIAQAHFNAHEILSRWVRFYFLVVAVPVTLLAILSRQNGQEQVFEVLRPSTSFSIILILVGLVGIFISLIIFDIRLDAALYARAVNGIRGYFLDQDKLERTATENNLRLDPSPYIILPRDTSRPSLTKLSINSFIFVLMFAAINSLYIWFGSWSLLSSHTQCGSTLSLMVITILSVIIHPICYKYIGKHKETQYTRPASPDV